LQLRRHALALLAATATLAGCGTSTAALSPRAMTATTAATAAAQRGSSQHSQAAVAKVSRDVWNGSLLYVGGDQETYIFRYPGGRLVGKIDTGSFGMCSDAQGHVFLTHVGKIEEYAHGGTTPIATLSVPGTAYACAVDPTTGKLATVVLCFSGCGAEIAIYPQPFGLPPRTYQDPGLKAMLFCGFDPAGNLYVDGYDSSGAFVLGELAPDGGSFTNITFDQSIQAAGQVQWDGTYITVETRIDPKIYQLQISGSTGTIAGTTELTGAGFRAAQSWIQGHSIILPNGPEKKRPKIVRIWKYPKGTRQTGVIKGFIPRHRIIDGLTVSVAPGSR
jgi:hypothetical protein